MAHLSRRRLSHIHNGLCKYWPTWPDKYLNYILEQYYIVVANDIISEYGFINKVIAQALSLIYNTLHEKKFAHVTLYRIYRLIL